MEGKMENKRTVQNAPSRQIGLSLLAAEDDPVVPKCENYPLTLFLHPVVINLFFFLLSLPRL